MKDTFDLTDLDLENKRVVVRVDYNIPIGKTGKLTSDKRILISLKTIRYILDHGAKQLILMTHIGRPKNREKELQTDAVAKRLSELINMPVKKIEGFGEKGVTQDRIIFLENLRFHPGEKDKDIAKRQEFGKQLASLGEVYVNEAFANCHRDHASMYEIPKYIPGCMGFGVKFEVETISDALRNPGHPFVSIIGGLKADKINAIKNLLAKADCILIGGALALLFYKLRGFNVGSTKIDEEGLPSVPIDIVNHDKIVLPVDYVVADSFSNNANTRVVNADHIEAGWQALDIGPRTISLFKERLGTAKTVVWNGPLGVFEMERFSKGTREVAEFVGDIDAVKIVGGGDCAAAIEGFGLESKMTLVSTGGGASLAMFEGSELPAIKALKMSYGKFKQA